MGEVIDLRRVPKHLIESATRIAGYLMCPLLEQRGTSPAMIAGTIRHWLVEQYIGDGVWRIAAAGPQADAVPDQWEQIEADVLRAVPHIPHPDRLLSVEGSALPTRYRFEAYGKTFAMIEVSPGYWLRGAADLVEEVDESTLGIVDWKGRERVDNEIQSLVYALMYTPIFPGFRRVRVKFVYLGSGEIEELRYEIDDLEQLRSYLVSIIDRKRANVDPKPTQCIRCASCIHFVTCPEGQAKAVAPLVVVPDKPKAVQIVDAVAQYQLPATVGERIELLRRVKIAASVAEALKDRLTDAFKDDLSAGPVVIDGREYRVADVGGQYYISDEDGAHRLAKLLGVTAAYKLDKGPFLDAVDLELARRKGAGEDLTELNIIYDAVVTQAKSKQIKERVAK